MKTIRSDQPIKSMQKMFNRLIETYLSIILEGVQVVPVLLFKKFIFFEIIIFLI